MKFLESLSIKDKLRAIVMIISGAVLLFTCTSLGIFGVVSIRSSLVSERSASAKIIAERIKAPMLSSDKILTTEILSALKSDPAILSAHIFDPDGKLFTEYAVGSSLRLEPTNRLRVSKTSKFFTVKAGSRFENNALLIFQPIISDNKEIAGMLVIQSDLSKIKSFIRCYIGMIILIGGFSFILLLFLLSRFQYMISKPILDLAYAAKSFSEKADYSARLPYQGEDELDILIEIFNNMLDQIMFRDTALIKSVKRAEESLMEARRMAEETNRTNVELENEINERKRAEAQLRESEEKYRNLIDFAPEGIFITGIKGELLSFNSAAIKIFKYDDPNLFSQISAIDFYQDPVKDRYDLVHKLLSDGHIENYEVKFKDKNGITFIASLSSRLIQYEGKTCIQSIIRDISHIKRMEESLRDYAENLEEMVEEKTLELRMANQELSDAITNLEETREQLAFKAHQAGMAELAVSVLHNIGNAINSINVRIYHHEDRLNNGEIPALEKIHTLLQSDDKIFTDSDRKEKLLKYFGTIISSFKEDRQMLKADCEFIKKGLDHLMEIISLQQKYAGVQGTETLEDVSEILKDSIEMLMDSIQKRGITVESDLTPGLNVLVNRNKMLQIFINIIKNAYEAIEMADPLNEKKIRLITSVEKEDGKEYVQIVIADTGVGISSEARERVFRFNYSTKERGTGFGLHDAANYINARNGTVTLQSKGIDEGRRSLSGCRFQSKLRET